MRCEIDSSGESFLQHQNFPRSTFPVAHAGSQQDLGPKAKGSARVGQQRTLKVVWPMVAWKGCALKIAVRFWKVGLFLIFMCKA